MLTLITLGTLLSLYQDIITLSYNNCHPISPKADVADSQRFMLDTRYTKFC